LRRKNNECHQRGAPKDEKGRTVSEMIDDLAGGQSTERGADSLHRCDRALGKVVATSASHDIGDHERAKDPCSYSIENLDPINQKLLSERV
jgi:hypothetical protein